MAEPRLIDNEKYPEELEAAALQLHDRIVELGVAEADAARIAWELAEHLRVNWGGLQTYIRAPEQADDGQIDLLGGAASAMPECEILADLAEQAEERLAATGCDPAQAAEMGARLAQHMNQFWGSGQLYICKGKHYEISLRDREIFRRFNGDNHYWLAREYDLTVQHVYRIVARVGAEERAKRQARLFADEVHNA